MARVITVDVGETLLLAKFKCPPNVRVSDIIREVKPATKCKGKTGREFYNCLSHILEQELIKRGCVRI